MDLLVRKARKHDKDAFTVLMEQNGKTMYKIAKAILKNDDDAADAMQETVLSCWEKIDTLKKDEFFKTWMVRILINKCNSIYRQRQRFVSDDELPEAGAWEESYANVEWQEFLKCLDEKYRTVVILYYGLKTESGVLELSLTRVGYDDVVNPNTEDLMETNRIEGSWNFSVPFDVDTESVREIAVNKQADNGYTLEKIFISPYQMVVYSDIPDTQMNNFYSVEVFDQDGKVIQWANSDEINRSVMPLQGREISRIYIYVVDDFDNMVAAEKGDQNAAAENSILQAEVEIN